MQLNDVEQIEFELTSRCNAGCPDCPRTLIKTYAGSKALHLNDISLANIKKWIPTKPANLKLIKLSGNLGDAGVHPEVYDILEYFGSFGSNIAIKMHTNGGMRNAEFWKKMGELSYKGKHKSVDDKFKIKIVWAIDGLEDTNHIYRIGVDWKKLMRNLNAYLDAGGYAEWHFISFPHNEHQEKDAEKLAKSLNMGFVIRKSVRNYRKERKAKKNTHSKVNHPILTVKGEKEKQEFGKKFAPSVACLHKTRNSVFIASDSTLWPCCMLWDEYCKKQSILSRIPDDLNWNNLNTYSIDSILHSEWYKDLNKFWTDNIYWRCIRSCAENGKFITEFETK